MTIFINQDLITNQDISWCVVSRLYGMSKFITYRSLQHPRTMSELLFTMIADLTLISIVWYQGSPPHQRFDDLPVVQTKAKLNHALSRGPTAEFGKDPMFESSRYPFSFSQILESNVDISPNPDSDQRWTRTHHQLPR